MRFVLLTAALAVCPIVAEAQEGGSATLAPPLKEADGQVMRLPMEAPGPDETLMGDDAVRESCRAAFRNIILNPAHTLGEVTVSTKSGYDYICRAEALAPPPSASTLLLRYMLAGDEPVVVISMKRPEQK
ncbi:hypothetical protein [Hyphomonas sp.]|uniref:hypothetical protein n=1 Tax=Hyphomonas sp. TaxID=87 RepID=UPI0025BBDD7C|nr:hypothetical protein [Hyphomonas sp.]